MSLDARTLILVTGSFYLALPWAVWLALRAPRSTGPLLWCGGGMVGGLGFALMGLRGFIPDQVSYLVGQPALVLGALMAAQSLRHDLGKPWRWQSIATFVLGYAVVLQYAFTQTSASSLGVLIRAVNLSAILALIAVCWQVARKERSKNALTIAVVYGVQCVAVMMNLVTAWLGSQEIHTLDGQTINTIAYLVMILVSLTGAMAYLGLSLERLESETLKLVQDAAQIEALREQRRRLVEAGRKNILDMLTRSLSHAMRQPLSATSLRFELARQLAQEGTKGRERLQNCLQEAVSDIQRTKATIESTRNMLKYRPHKETTRVNLIDVLGELHQLVEHQAQAQATSIHFQSHQPSPIVLGHKTTLTYALLQLVQNALTAVSRCDKREIRLLIEASAKNVRIQIKDSGPGMPAEVIHRFSGKTEVWPSRLQSMGLFVVKHIIQEQGGSLFLENSTSGGACVTVQLPLAF